MRQFAIFLLIVLSCTNVRSQPVESKNRALTVEKARKDQKVIYTFKPDKRLMILTNDKVKYITNNYLVLDNALIISSFDTIYFNDIAIIKGKIYSGIGRKTLGAFVSLISIPNAAFWGFLFGPYAVLGYIPFAGTFIGGVSLMGARKFITSDKWTLVPQ